MCFKQSRENENDSEDGTNEVLGCTVYKGGERMEHNKLRKAKFGRQIDECAFYFSSLLLSFIFISPTHTHFRSSDASHLPFFLP